MLFIFSTRVLFSATLFCCWVYLIVSWCFISNVFKNISSFLLMYSLLLSILRILIFFLVWFSTKFWIRRKFSWSNFSPSRRKREFSSWSHQLLLENNLTFRSIYFPWVRKGQNGVAAKFLLCFAMRKRLSAYFWYKAHDGAPNLYFRYRILTECNHTFMIQVFEALVPQFCVRCFFSEIAFLFRI